MDDDTLRERWLLLRRWGRRSEIQVFGGKGERSIWEKEPRNSTTGTRRGAHAHDGER